MSTSLEACTALTKSGKLCGKTIGTRATPDGSRCASHLPPDPKKKSERPRPPVSVPKTTQDAVRLSAWAIGQVAAGTLSQPECNAIASM